MSDSLRPHEPQHARPPWSIPNSRSPPKPMSIESVMPTNHPSLCHPLLLLSSIFPSWCWKHIWSFQMSQLFASGGQSMFTCFLICLACNQSSVLAPLLNSLYTLKTVMTSYPRYQSWTPGVSLYSSLFFRLPLVPCPIKELVNP